MEMKILDRIECALLYLVEKVPRDYFFNVEGIDAENNIVKLKFNEGIAYLLFVEGNFSELSQEAFIGLIAHELAHKNSPPGTEDYKAYIESLDIKRKMLQIPNCGFHRKKQELERDFNKITKNYDLQKGEREYNNIEEDTDKLAKSWGFEKEIIAIQEERNFLGTVAELKKDW